MSFVRPEANAALWRWREVIIGGVLAAVGIWWALKAQGPVFWIGWVGAAAGLALIVAGLQRSRFRIPGQGPGIVSVTEGQITYFGPLTGGAIALSELTQISFDPSGRPGHWVLTQPGQLDLYIPISADGADALFDAFASLPGMRTEHMLSEMKRQGGAPGLIWQSDGQKTARLSLH
ncbi:MAG: hypothetical protein AB8B82_15130 [Roseovarius sp.]